MFDLTINNGKVFTGKSSESIKANIGIKNDKIQYIGSETLQSKKSIDARDYLVSPGFIDLHTHSDISFLVDPDADSKLTQGVTFELMGNCGMSFCAPLSATSSQTLKDRIAKYNIELDIDWNDFEGWLNKISENIPSLNVAAQLGHGILRAHVMGMKSVSATPDDINKMGNIIRSSIDQGILGFCKNPVSGCGFPDSGNMSFPRGKLHSARMAKRRLKSTMICLRNASFPTTFGRKALNSYAYSNVF